MPSEPSRNGELVQAALPAAGPVRALELGRASLPALPLSGSTLAAAGGFLAGAATLVTLRLARRSRLLPGGRRRGARRELQKRSVVATRSFLVDVHLLGR
jgi:hypothetical protein